LISNLQHIKDYQDGFKETDGWYWRLNTWNLAATKLNECKTTLEDIIEAQDEADKSGRQVLALT
jgi:DNA-binding ferritin-like protein (Dps family)